MDAKVLKEAVAEKFAQQGIWLNAALPMTAMVQKAETLTGIKRADRQSIVNYLMKFAGVKYEYNIAPRLSMPTDRHFSWQPPRMSDIERAQPPLLTPCGVGNGSENSPVWRR